MDEYAVRHEHADRQLMTLNTSRTSPLNSLHRRVLGVLMYEELHGRDCSVITITCLQAREIQDIRRLLTSFTASLNDRKNTLVLTSVRVHHEAFIEEDFQTWKHLMVRCFPSFVDPLEMEQICAVVLPSSPKKHVPASYGLSDVSMCSSGHFNLVCFELIVWLQMRYDLSQKWGVDCQKYAQVACIQIGERLSCWQGDISDIRRDLTDVIACGKLLFPGSKHYVYRVPYPYSLRPVSSEYSPFNFFLCKDGRLCQVMTMMKGCSRNLLNKNGAWVESQCVAGIHRKLCCLAIDLAVGTWMWSL